MLVGMVGQTRDAEKKYVKKEWDNFNQRRIGVGKRKIMDPFPNSHSKKKESKERNGRHSSVMQTQPKDIRDGENRVRPQDL